MSEKIEHTLRYLGELAKQRGPLSVVDGLILLIWLSFVAGVVWLVPYILAP